MISRLASLKNLDLYLNVSIYLVVGLFFHSITCPPVTPQAKEAVHVEGSHINANDTINDPILALEYHRYLKQIVYELETDPNFKRMIENASVDDIKSGKIASNLEFVNHNIRTKLDELKRQEIDRLRKLISRKIKLNNLEPHHVESLIPKHLDHDNAETFEIKDLEILIKKATLDLEEVDKLKKEQFKEHEIEKEYERRKKLQDVDAETRKKMEGEHEKLVEQRKHHEKVNHPGSKDQLEEVWEKQDHLDGQQFNPHTFFNLHDMDGNGFLDPDEIEALFQIELDKIFNTSDPEYDPKWREQEADNMRQHVSKEIDTNGDKMISLSEFLHATKERDFKNNEEWKSVEDVTQFNQQDFENYSKSHINEEHPSTLPTPPAVDNHQQQQHQQQQHQQQQQPPQQPNQH